MESIHDIFKVFLTYDDRQDITAHQCSVDVIKLYRNHLALHLNALKERLLEEYQKRYELEEMPTALVTRPQATDTSSVPPIAPPAASETFGERTRRLFDKRADAAMSRDNTAIEVATRPATREQSCSRPRWDNLPSGHQRYLLKGLNLGYMYWGQIYSSE